MGWLWSSQNAPPGKLKGTSDEPVTRPPPQAGLDVAHGTAAPTGSSSRDEIAAEEWKQFLADLNADSDDTTNFTTAKGPTSTGDEPTSESIYPNSMSCRQAWDQAYFCQSFGGQFMNVYRYGELRKCSEHWSEFWFCMRTRNYSDEKRQEMIRQHYRQKEAKYKLGPSCEDVWRPRTQPLRAAFGEDTDDPARGTKIS